jgi:small subunit ribosomal protein S9
MRSDLAEPFKLTNTIDTYNVKVNVHGGGISGQAGAVRHGITKALILADPDLRMPLKKAGFVKRDPRVKERKKYGQKGARARFQFSKR